MGHAYQTLRILAAWSSHILRKSGLLARLELLLPELALPIRLHECRAGYAGHAGSYETTLTGLSVRLDEGGRADNIEPDCAVYLRRRTDGCYHPRFQERQSGNLPSHGRYHFYC